MSLGNLIKPLELLRNEAFSIESVSDYQYLFDNFAVNFQKYALRRDADSFQLLSLDEIACLTRFTDDGRFLRESLMVIIDVMDIVRRDYLNDVNEEDKEAVGSLITKVIDDINKLVDQPDDYEPN